MMYYYYILIDSSLIGKIDSYLSFPRVLGGNPDKRKLLINKLFAFFVVSY
jgi:hypothetical protein